MHALVLPSPTLPFSAAEVTALHAFVDAGGSLVVLSREGGPAAAGTNLNDLTGKCDAVSFVRRAL